MTPDVLSEFLRTGTFDLYITRKGGNPFKYERITISRRATAAVDFLDRMKRDLER